MISYEELVVALSNWRAHQGLPAQSVSFMGPASGSVDLALPVSDLDDGDSHNGHAEGDAIQQIATSEVDALIDDVDAYEGEVEDGDFAAYEAHDGQEASTALQNEAHFGYEGGEATQFEQQALDSYDDESADDFEVAQEIEVDDELEVSAVDVAEEFVADDDDFGAVESESTTVGIGVDEMLPPGSKEP